MDERGGERRGRERERRSGDGSNVLQYVSVKGSMPRVRLPGMCQVPGV